MSEELQKHGFATTRAEAETAENRELVLNDASGETPGSENGPEIVISNDAKTVFYHYPSLERLDDTTAGNSGLGLIGVDETNLTIISGSDSQTLVESIDSSLSTISSSVGTAIQSDGSVPWVANQSVGGNGFTNLASINSSVYFDSGNLGVGGVPTEDIHLKRTTGAVLLVQNTGNDASEIRLDAVKTTANTTAGALTFGQNSVYMSQIAGQLGATTSVMGLDFYVYNSTRNLAMKIEDDRNIICYPDNAGDGIHIYESDAGNIAIKLQAYDAGGNIEVNAGGSVKVSLSAVNGVSYFLDQNVGIGDSTPTDARLKVEEVLAVDDHIAYLYSNTAQTGDGLRVFQDSASTTGTTLWIRQDGTGDIIQAYDSTVLTLALKDGGKLQLFGHADFGLNTAMSVASSTYINLRLGILASTPSNTTDAFIGVHNTGGPGSIAGDLILIPRTTTATPGAIRLFTGATTPLERVTIDTSGRVGFGLTTLTNAFEVKNDAVSQYAIRAERSSTSALLGGIYESSGGDGQLLLTDVSGNTDVLLNTNGLSYFNGGSFSIGSTALVGSEKLYIKVSATGAYTPATGTALLIESASNAYIEMVGNDGDSQGLIFKGDTTGVLGYLEHGGTGGVDLYAYTSLDIITGSSPSTRLSINGSGNITVSAPSSGSVMNISMVDNASSGMQILQGANSYLKFVTTDGSESIDFGNATTNPAYNFLGTGILTTGGDLVAGNDLDVTNDLSIGGKITSVGYALGSLQSDASASITTAGTYYHFTSAAVQDYASQYFTPTLNEFGYTYSGPTRKYWVRFIFDSNAMSGTPTFRISKNGTQLTDQESKDFDATELNAVIELSSTDKIALMVTSASNGDTCTLPAAGTGRPKIAQRIEIKPIE